MKYNDNGVIKEINIKASDTLPIGSIIEYSGDTVPEGYERIEPSLDYICVRTYSETNISKSGSYGGVDVPFFQIMYQKNNSDFNLVNNKVYYNGTKRAVIQVNYNIVSTVQGYMLGGGVNNSYTIITSFAPNHISGYSANCSSTLIVKQGDYISCMIGSPDAFSDQIVYGNSGLSAYVLAYLE